MNKIFVFCTLIVYSLRNKGFSYLKKFSLEKYKFSDWKVYSKNLNKKSSMSFYLSRVITTPSKDNLSAL